MKPVRVDSFVALISEFDDVEDSWDFRRQILDPIWAVYCLLLFEANP